MATRRRVSRISGQADKQNGQPAARQEAANCPQGLRKSVRNGFETGRNKTLKSRNKLVYCVGNRWARLRSSWLTGGCRASRKGCLHLPGMIPTRMTSCHPDSAFLSARVARATVSQRVGVRSALASSLPSAFGRALSPSHHGDGRNHPVGRKSIKPPPAQPGATVNEGHDQRPAHIRRNDRPEGIGSSCA